MPDARARLAVALDLPERAAILAMARRVAPEAGVLKVGLEAFVAEGPSPRPRAGRTGADVFLDLKLHDIPNTVGRAAAAAVATGAAILNCHASGGREMMRAFGDQAPRGGLEGRPRGSEAHRRDGPDLARRRGSRRGRTLRDAARRPPCASPSSRGSRASTASSARRRRSPRSAPRAGRTSSSSSPACGPRARDTGDQKRVATPAEAIRAGADLLVVGRPITGAPDPAAAARAVVAEIAGAQSTLIFS